jgi:hypothetical protein
MIRPGRAAAFIGGTVSAFLAASAFAADLQEAAPPETAEKWRLSVAPYLWGAGLNGDVGLFGRQPVDIDMSFSEIFSDLKFGGMLVSELHNGTWGIFGDIIYVKTKAEETASRNLRRVPVDLDLSVETSSFTGTLMGEYRAFASESITVDLMAGARIWSVDNEIDARLAVGDTSVAAFSGSDGSTWVDPIIGIRGRLDTGTPWFFNAWGMVGGFGASSDITWDALGGAGYQWNERFSIVAGYRALGVDYSDDGFVYDVVQHGPYLGTIIQF